MIVFQFKDIAFVSYIQEKYKLPASLNSFFNTFHDLRLSKQSSKLFILTFLSEKDDRWTGLLSTNICLLYQKKFNWMQDGTSELETK